MSYALADLAEQGPPPLLRGVTSLDDWDRKRARIRATWMECTGGIPPRVAPAMQVLSVEQEPTHTRMRIVYDTVHGDQVPAYLLVPRDEPNADRLPPAVAHRRPAVLALHSTVDTGKDDVAHPAGRENRRYGLELVRRGYVVLAPDALTAGDRICPGRSAFQSDAFYARHPNWSMVAKNVVDHMQAIDVLGTLDFVDSGRIGAIGHSFGAYNAYFLAGFDPRVKAVVASCGLGPFGGSPDPGVWGIREDWYTLLPAVTQHLGQDRVPFEFNEILGLCAPVPLLLYSARQDHIFPHWEAVVAVGMDVHRLYAWLGAGDRYQFRMGAGGHDFPGPVRQAGYAFLDRWLSTEAQ